ncbi:hypothetical protein P3T35_005536 [Kitasatospora sp. GP30]|uniref:hypothetical protein n=1 Tax=Kitasatospora sp. GP30 TaxID=3035084 RepID=UPI002472F82D|nr:hypothetical protein [Kitasatospora sp. GP30]MDH6143501.1 hypothetical protein [Kitasatospora sp. GP30]
MLSRQINSLEEKFELIASGRGIALIPLSVARSYSRPDLANIPVTHAPEIETCLAVAADRREKPLARLPGDRHRDCGTPERSVREAAASGGGDQLLAGHRPEHHDQHATAGAGMAHQAASGSARWRSPR